MPREEGQYDRAKAPTEKKSELSTMRAEFLKNAVSIAECKDPFTLNNKLITGIALGISALETKMAGRNEADQIQKLIDSIDFQTPKISTGEEKGQPLLNADIGGVRDTFFAYNAQVPVMVAHSNNSAERKMNFKLFRIYTKLKRHLSRLGFLPWNVNYADDSLTVEKIMALTGDPGELEYEE